MKCPVCSAVLVPEKFYGIETEHCPSCHGRWLTAQELNQLEDLEFPDDALKGTMIFNTYASDRVCPVCTQPLKRFRYRLYDLELDYCPDHGYWLDAGEEKRVLELIKVEVKGLERKFSAEDKWAATLRSLHHPDFVEKLKNLFR